MNKIIKRLLLTILTTSLICGCATDKQSSGDSSDKKESSSVADAVVSVADAVSTVGGLFGGSKSDD